MAHHGDGHVKIRHGMRFALEVQFKSLGPHGCRQQQGRGKLAALAHIDDHLTASYLISFDVQWQKSFVLNILDIAPQDSQRIHQGFDGTSLHAFRTRQKPIAFVTGQIGRHETGCCAAIGNDNRRFSQLGFTQGLCQNFRVMGI